MHTPPSDTPPPQDTHTPEQPGCSQASRAGVSQPPLSPPPVWSQGVELSMHPAQPEPGAEPTAPETPTSGAPTEGGAACASDDSGSARTDGGAPEGQAVPQPGETQQAVPQPGGTQPAQEAVPAPWETQAAPPPSGETQAAPPPPPGGETQGGELSRVDDDVRLFSQAGFSQFSWLPGGASQAPLTQTQASEAAGSSQRFGPPGALPAFSSEANMHDGSDDDDDDLLGLKTLNVFAAVRRAMDGVPHY